MGCRYRRLEHTDGRTDKGLTSLLVKTGRNVRDGPLKSGRGVKGGRHVGVDSPDEIAPEGHWAVDW